MHQIINIYTQKGKATILHKQIQMSKKKIAPLKKYDGVLTYNQIKHCTTDLSKTNELPQFTGNDSQITLTVDTFRLDPPIHCNILKDAICSSLYLSHSKTKAATNNKCKLNVIFKGKGHKYMCMFIYNITIIEQKWFATIV